MLNIFKYYSNPQELARWDAVLKTSKDDGTVVYTKNGQLHRNGDQPAYIGADGSQEWYKNGQLHRDGDLPAVIYESGSQVWYKNGQRHRDGDLPAYIGSDGSQEWYKNDLRHRDGDQPAFIGADGTQVWYKNNQIHRIRGPAVIFDEYKEWWFEDEIVGRSGKLTNFNQKEYEEWLSSRGYSQDEEDALDRSLQTFIIKNDK